MASSFSDDPSYDIVEHLREHAARVAGGGPSESTYDPETLCLETDAADEIARLRKIIADKKIDEDDTVLVYMDGMPRMVPRRVDCHYAARGALGVPRGVAVLLQGQEKPGKALPFLNGHTFIEGQRYRSEWPGGE